MPKILLIPKLPYFLMAFLHLAYIFLTFGLIFFRYFYLWQENRLRKLSFPFYSVIQASKDLIFG